MEFGLCPGNAEPGDTVAMFLGSGVLHVIRPAGLDGDGNPSTMGPRGRGICSLVDERPAP